MAVNIGLPKKKKKRKRKKPYSNKAAEPVIETTKVKKAGAASGNIFAPIMPGSRLGRVRARSPMREVGLTGLRSSGGWIFEEFLTELRGLRGVHVYDEMRRNDPVVGAMLFVAEQLIHNATLHITPPNQSLEALKAAMLVETSIEDTDKPWADVLAEMLTMLPFGWSMMNIVHKKREGYKRNSDKSSRFDDGLIGWGKMSLRGQDTQNGWILGKHGEILGLNQIAPPTYQNFVVPMSNCGLFRTRAEKNNPEGYSILRNAWRPWFIKKNLEEVEAIGVERDLTGLPMLQTPEGLDIWNTNDADAVATLQRAEEIVRLIRMDKYEGLVLPFGWEFKLQTTPGQRAHNTSDIIARWDQRIAVTMLADMLLIGHERVGSFALVSSKTKLFSSALESYASRIAHVFNRHLIPRMMLLNGMAQENWPMLSFGPVETPALKELGDYTKVLSDVGVNIDESIATYLRQVASLPPPKDGDEILKPKEEMQPQLPFGQDPKEEDDEDKGKEEDKKDDDK